MMHQRQRATRPRPLRAKRPRPKLPLRVRAPRETKPNQWAKTASRKLGRPRKRCYPCGQKGAPNAAGLQVAPSHAGFSVALDRLQQSRLQTLAAALKAACGSFFCAERLCGPLLVCGSAGRFGSDAGFPWGWKIAFTVLGGWGIRWQFAARFLFAPVFEMFDRSMVHCVKG